MTKKNRDKLNELLKNIYEYADYIHTTDDNEEITKDFAAEGMVREIGEVLEEVLREG